MLETTVNQPASSATPGGLWLAARDPHWLCAMWDAATAGVLAASVAEGLFGLGKKRAYLRIIADAGGDSFIPLPSSARQWFARVPGGAAACTAQLGTLDNDARWTAIAASARVRVPSAIPASEPVPEEEVFVAIPPTLSFEEMDAEAATTAVKSCADEEPGCVIALAEAGFLQTENPPVEAGECAWTKTQRTWTFTPPAELCWPGGGS